MRNMHRLDRSRVSCPARATVRVSAPLGLSPQTPAPLRPSLRSGTRSARVGAAANAGLRLARRAWQRVGVRATLLRVVVPVASAHAALVRASVAAGARLAGALP